MIENTALLTSLGSPSAASDTRTNARLVGVFGTLQLWLPSLGVLEMMVVQLAPLLVEYSNFTLAKPPGELHVIFWLVATVQLSPPFGEFNCKAAGGFEVVWMTSTGATVPSFEL
jgi:hypothetical protein